MVGAPDELQDFTIRKGHRQPAVVTGLPEQLLTSVADEAMESLPCGLLEFYVGPAEQKYDVEQRSLAGGRPITPQGGPRSVPACVR